MKIVWSLKTSLTDGAKVGLKHDLFDFDSNKINHILQEKHLWSRLVEDKDWYPVKKIASCVLEEGMFI